MCFVNDGYKLKNTVNINSIDWIIKIKIYINVLKVNPNTFSINSVDTFLSGD